MSTVLIEDAKRIVADKWKYNTWEDLWNTFYDSKEIHQIVEDLAWEYGDLIQKNSQ